MRLNFYENFLYYVMSCIFDEIDRIRIEKGYVPKSTLDKLVGYWILSDYGYSPIWLGNIPKEYKNSVMRSIANEKYIFNKKYVELVGRNYRRLIFLQHKTMCEEKRARLTKVYQRDYRSALLFATYPKDVSNYTQAERYFIHWRSTHGDKVGGLF